MNLQVMTVPIPPGAGSLAARCRRILAWLLRLLMPAAALLLNGVASAAPPAATLDVQRQADAVHVVARSTVRAGLRTTWDTLIGYERLPEFVPDMRSSRVLQRDGGQVLVEQRGSTGFGPLRRDFGITLSVQEHPLQSVTARAIDGDFVRFESTYRLRAGDDGSTQLEYDALIEPKDGIPPLIGVAVMRLIIRRQFDALLVEIERRALAPPAG
jgi:ribosome-associated toxin RatA of RatAB toxin-antitoxin module